MSFRIYIHSVKIYIFLFHLTIFVPQLVYYRKSNFKLTCLVHSQVHIFLPPASHSSLSFSPQKRGGRWAWVQGCAPAEVSWGRSLAMAPQCPAQSPSGAGKPQGNHSQPCLKMQLFSERDTQKMNLAYLLEKGF